MKTIASIALALACASVMAQSTSPTDVPKDHWAYPAVTNLYRLGILNGYPDGTFKGTRPVSRYELGVAVNALFTSIKNETDGIIFGQPDLQATPFASISDLAALRRDMDTLRTDISTIRATKTDVSALNADFAAMNQQLRAIRASLAETRAKLDKTKD